MDEEAAPSGQPGGAPDLGWHPPGASPKDPGWYPAGSNPNEQAYWDGGSWTGQRHWSVNGWVDQGGAPATAPQGDSPAASGSRWTSANPYAPPPNAAKRRRAPMSLSLGVLLLMVSGVALMFGSVGSWIEVSGSGSFGSLLSFHASFNGIDQGVSQLIGVNGYVTFIAGVVLLVLGGLAMTNDDVALAIVTAFAAAATLVFAIYDMFRIVQKVSQATLSGGGSVSVGAGLICVLAAATLAALVAFVRLLSR